MRKWCLHASSFIFDQVVIKVAGNQDRHKSSDEFDFGSLVSMAHLYVFEMGFDLGTLDSGERSLPFGLLVYPWKHMLWVLIRIASPRQIINEYQQHMILWRTIENYPVIISKYPHMFHCIYVL